MSYRICYLLLLFTLFTAQSGSANTYTTKIDPKTKELSFYFKSAKGTVRFNHDLHKAKMEADACLPCHKTNTPTKDHTMTRLDQRAAHSFCKGCHREKGRGPVECHECHRGNK